MSLNFGGKKKVRFDELYPDIELGSSTAPVRKSDEELPCSTCGDSTQWVERDFKIPVCSEMCLCKALSELKDEMFEEPSTSDSMKNVLN